MKTMTKALLAAALALTTTAAMADFPERKLQVVYPWAPGTPTYGVSQLIAEGMSERLGQAIPVVAQPGSGGVRAFKSFLNEPADGYTIMDGYVAPLVISPLFGDADWNCADFTPLYSATSNAFAIAVRPDEDRFTDFPSFINFLKENPGKTAYNGSGTSLPHLIAARVMQQMGTLSRAVPYDDLALGMKDLRNGTLDWIVVNPGVYRANKEQLKILVTLSELDAVSEAYDGAPKPVDYDIDIGVSGLAPMGWNWWVVKSDTDEDRVAKLREAMNGALQDPDIREKIKAVGFVPMGLAPDEYLATCEDVARQLTEGVEAVKWEEKGLRGLR